MARKQPRRDKLNQRETERPRFCIRAVQEGERGGNEKTTVDNATFKTYTYIKWARHIYYLPI